MTREEAIEILTKWANDLQEALCSECPPDDCKGREHDYCDRYYALEKIKEAGQFIIKHEQDLLKEFVEWQAKQYKDLYYLYEEEIKKEKDHDDYIWLLGKKAGIGEIRQSLKIAIEEFLEERK